MGKWLHKLLFVVISISFFISATEMDIGEAHNTFYDEYDTYVKTEQVSVDHSEVKQQQQKLLEFVSLLFPYLPSFTKKALQLPKTNYVACKASFPKLFLRNSIWRI